MINTLTGTITQVNEQQITLSVGGIGFAIAAPHMDSFTTEKQITLHTYMHWNTDQGPSLFGFESASERDVFLLMLECPKVGPKIALAVLSQMSVPAFLEAINSQNESALSSIVGIGTKKAEQMIAHLKHKVSKLLTSGKLDASITQSASIDWGGMSAALTSLGYSKPEISKALEHVGSLAKEQTTTSSFDTLLRRALAFLSSRR